MTTMFTAALVLAAAGGGVLFGVAVPALGRTLLAEAAPRRAHASLDRQLEALSIDRTLEPASRAVRVGRRPTGVNQTMGELASSASAVR